MNRVTIQEIASILGFSRNTVSKAMSGSDAVSRETRAIVIKKAIEMGYPAYRMVIPDELIPSIPTDEKKNILILMKRETSNFWNRLILGISDIINQHQDTMQLQIIMSGDEEDNYIPPEFASHVDGIIILSVFRQTYVDRLMQLKIPVVFFDAPVHCDDFLQYGDVIMPENYFSMRKLATSLIKQGLKRLSFVGDIHYCCSIMERYEGYAAALAENGLVPDPQIQFTDHVFGRYYEGNEVGEAISHCPYTPDAFVCANDDIARYLYTYLKAQGLNIPKDVAVTGFDNSEAGQVLVPELTTVQVHIQSIGRRLANQLYFRMANPDAPKEIVHINSDIELKESSRRRKLF